MPASQLLIHGRPVVPPEVHPADLGIMDAAAFLRAEYRREWLIKNIAVKGKPGVVGGAQKTLKTSLSIEIAISVAVAIPFLGRDEFRPPVARKVLIIPGESGESAIQEIIRRICRARDVHPDYLAGWLYVGFTLPQLSDPNDLAGLAEFIKEKGIEVVIIDPLYLCLMGSGSAIDPKNLFSVGPCSRRSAILA